MSRLFESAATLNMAKAVGFSRESAKVLQRPATSGGIQPVHTGFIESFHGILLDQQTGQHCCLYLHECTTNY